MGIDYLVCNYCGEGFPDVIDYKSCEGCWEKTRDSKYWCSKECAEQEGFVYGTMTDEDGDEVCDYDNTSCGYCRGEIEETVEVAESQKKILDIVMRYAEKHKDMWGVDGFVHQNDKAMLEAIDLYSEIISALPVQEEPIE